MATETGGVSPDSTPATATDENVAGEEVSSTAAAAGSTTTAPKEGAAAATPKLIESVDQPRFSEAVDVEGYEKKKRDALKQVPSLEESAAGHEVPEEVTSDQGPVTSGEEPPAATEVVEGEPTEPEAPEVLPERIRLGGLSDTDKGHLIAAKALATAEKIPLAEAMLRVTGGGAKKAEATETPAVTEPEPPTLRTREEVEADIAAAKQDRKSAAKDADEFREGGNSRLVDATERLEKLAEELVTVNRKFDEDVKTSNAEAVKFYPDSGKKGTPLYNRITEIAKMLEKSGDPLIYQIDAPLVVAQMAAKELRIAPADPITSTITGRSTSAAAQQKPTTSTATRPAPVNQTAVSRSPQPAATPASGAARTNHGNGAAPVAFEKIKTVQDYEELKDKLLQPA